MSDDFRNFSSGPSGFGRFGVLGVPSDTVDFVRVAKGIVCLTGGNISVIPADNDTSLPISFVGIAAGYVVPFVVRRVNATGTTCTWATIEH